MRYLIIFLLATLAGCQSGGVGETPQGQSSSLGGAEAAPATGDYFAGKVVETMDAGGYTYVLVDTGPEQIWAAGPQQAMEVGTALKIAKSMPMRDFHSAALERDFELLYFVSDFGGNSGGDPHADGEMPAGHGAMGGMSGGAPAGDIDLTGIAPASQTVAQVFELKASLAGKPVKVRGKVVKALPGIMGTNWMHIQDGTGEAGTNDLTITCEKLADVGSTVLIEGTLTVDKDFGAGYSYSVIVENAKVTVE